MYKKGIIAGNFDVIHPGYIAMFKECKSYCEEFIIFLHTDPSIERPEKLSPCGSDRLPSRDRGVLHAS